MRKMISLMLAVAAPAIAHAQTSHDQLTQVINDHWKWYLSVHPVEATARGVRDYDDQISDLSLAARDAQINTEQDFVTRLDAVPETELDAADKVNRAVLLWMLRDDIASDKHQAER